MVLLIMRKNNVMTLSDIKSVLKEPMKLAKCDPITDTDLVKFLLNHDKNRMTGGPIAFLSADFGRFILASDHCVSDISKILQKLVIGEHYIEKMQRAQMNFSTDYKALPPKQQLLRDIVLRELLENANGEMVSLNGIVDKLLRNGILRKDGPPHEKKVAQRWLVEIFNELHFGIAQQASQTDIDTTKRFIYKSFPNIPNRGNQPEEQLIDQACEQFLSNQAGLLEQYSQQMIAQFYPKARQNHQEQGGDEHGQITEVNADHQQLNSQDEVLSDNSVSQNIANLMFTFMNRVAP